MFFIPCDDSKLQFFKNVYCSTEVFSTAILFFIWNKFPERSPFTFSPQKQYQANIKASKLGCHILFLISSTNFTFITSFLVLQLPHLSLTPWRHALLLRAIRFYYTSFLFLQIVGTCLRNVLHKCYEA